MRLLRYLPYVAVDWLYITARQIQRLFSRDTAEGYLHPKHAMQPAVIIIPGIYEPWQFMKPVAQVLFDRGHAVHMLDSLGYNTGSIPDMAALVYDYVEKHDLRDVAIVAHSKGGLIGKYVMVHHDQNARINTLIAIGTPFSGSVYAAFLPIPGVRMFAPTAQYVRELLANQDLNSKITSIYSSYDPNIPAGSYLPGATNISIDTVGHFRIVNNRATQQAVLNALSTHGTNQVNRP